MRSFFCFLLILCAFTTNSQAQYQRWNKLRQENAGHTLNDVYFTDLMHGVAVGNTGTVIITNDGGAHWNEIANQLTEDLYAIGFSTPTIGCIPGNQGYNYYTTDGGFHWEITANGYPTNLGTLAKEYVDPNSGNSFIGGGPTILEGYGATWTAKTIAGMRVMEGMGIVATGQGLLGDDLGNLFRSTDGGGKWDAGRKVFASQFVALEYPQKDTAYATTGAWLYRSIDSGMTWTPDTIPGISSITSISFYNARLGVGVTSKGKFFSTTDAGASWTVQPTIGYPTRVRLYSPTHAIIVGGGGTLTETTDFGTSWTVHPGKFSNDLYAAACPSADRVIVSGDRLIAYSDDGGSNWIRPANIPTDSYRRMRFIDAMTGIALGDSVALRTTDGGTTWYRLPIPHARAMQAVQLLDRDKIVIVTELDSLYRSADGGATWKVLKIPQNYSTIVHFSDDNHGVALGLQTYETNDGGITWTAEPPDHLFAMQTDYWLTPTYGFVAGQNGVQGITHDGGHTWVSDTVKNGGYTTALVMTDSSNGTLVTGGDVVWHTTDAGVHWVGQFRDSVIPPGTLGLNGVAFATPEIGYAVGYNGLILKTTNGTSLDVTQRPTSHSATETSAHVYPNPASNNVTLETTSSPFAKARVQLFDAKGSLVAALATHASESGLLQFGLATTSLPEGLYFYRLQSEASSITGKFVVAH